jgi:hypothetical protein
VDQRARGRKISIEDTSGKEIEPSFFGIEEGVAVIRSTNDILKLMVSKDGHIRVLRGPTDEYISICRADGSAMFAETLPREMFDDLVKASFIRQDGPENGNKVTIYRLTEDGRARGK